jgi:hypothetical protein
MRRQFTMNVDDGLLRAAKVHAARRGTTVSAMVRRLLEEELGMTSAAPSRLGTGEADGVLARFATGGMTLAEAMRSAGLTPEGYGEFADRMAALGLAWPKGDLEAVERGAAAVAAAVSAVREQGEA